jgi:hypothetical protein
VAIYPAHQSLPGVLGLLAAALAGPGLAALYLTPLGLARCKGHLNWTAVHVAIRDPDVADAARRSAVLGPAGVLLPFATATLDALLCTERYMTDGARAVVRPVFAVGVRKVSYAVCATATNGCPDSATFGYLWAVATRLALFTAVQVAGTADIQGLLAYLVVMNASTLAKLSCFARGNPASRAAEAAHEVWMFGKQTVPEAMEEREFRAYEIMVLTTMQVCADVGLCAVILSVRLFEEVSQWVSGGLADAPLRDEDRLLLQFFFPRGFRGFLFLLVATANDILVELLSHAWLRGITGRPFGNMFWRPYGFWSRGSLATACGQLYGPYLLVQLAHVFEEHQTGVFEHGVW